jgi:competence ComEA-like helix-hairpin-helix protein
MIRSSSVTLLVSVLFYLAPGQAPSPAPSATGTLPDGPGKEIAQRACTTCHSLSVITSRRASSDEWSKTVTEMVTRGADLSDDEIDRVIQYLSTNFAPAKSEPASAGAASQPSSDKPAASGTPAPASTLAPINVNKASAQELESSLTLSRAEAEAIVQYRGKHGDFKTWQEVSAVPGVVPEKIKSNRTLLTF